VKEIHLSDDISPEEYIELVKITESVDFSAIAERLGQRSTIRVLHAAMGLCTEAAEALDACKKHVFYGKPLDLTNLFEESGDLMWYLGILLDELGSSFAQAMFANIEKLRARYEGRFDETKALDRDLAKERELLESQLPDGDEAS
jgi:NTP pyrophosphatase (non-canonical NTP hydrolase)